jgi:AGZA family xanthine/uracil permease-like MFS transporter
MGYVDEEGNFPRSKWAFAADALATMFGSLFGLSPVTSFIEAGAGVQAGARTGLCAVFCGIFFFISIFFAPIIASIPPWASGGALIIVGAMMAKSLGQIKWHIPSHALSAFLTVIIMPLTYSIAYGLIAGICSYFIMEGTYVLLALVGIAKPVYEDPYAVEAASTEEVVGDEAVVDPDDDKTKTAAGDGSDENSEEVPEGGEAESAVEQATEESKPTV